MPCSPMLQQFALACDNCQRYRLLVKNWRRLRHAEDHLPFAVLAKLYVVHASSLAGSGDTNNKHPRFEPAIAPKFSCERENGAGIRTSPCWKRATSATAMPARHHHRALQLCAAGRGSSSCCGYGTACRTSRNFNGSQPSQSNLSRYQPQTALRRAAVPRSDLCYA
jgi:hypothetical protein